MITILYDIIGGIGIVIQSDVLQMGIVILGLLIVGGTAWSWVGWTEAWGAMDPGRLQILDFRNLGLSSGGQYGFWPMLIGGMFLYASYYGCDQSQVQRYLTAKSVDQARASLLMSAYWKIPLQALVLLVGVFMFLFYLFTPSPRTSLEGHWAFRGHLGGTQETFRHSGNQAFTYLRHR